MQSSSQTVTTNKPTPRFLHAGCPSCRPTNSVRALKDVILHRINILCTNDLWLTSHLLDDECTHTCTPHAHTQVQIQPFPSCRSFDTVLPLSPWSSKLLRDGIYIYRLMGYWHQRADERHGNHPKVTRR